jgi:hypothetical protein
MKSHLYPIALVLATSVFLPGANAGESVKFSDPAKPRILKLHLGLGMNDVRIQGAETNEVQVTSKAASTQPRQDGLRPLVAVSKFTLTEKDNVVILEAPPHEETRGRGDFSIIAPRDVALVIEDSAGGDIHCAQLSGDIDISTMHGVVRLDEVTGGVVVSTMQGEIHATLRELREGKPISLTSVHGPVVVRLPETARANIRLRSISGNILTDFDPNVLVTETQVSRDSSVSSRFVAKGADGKSSTASASASASNDGIQQKPRKPSARPADSAPAPRTESSSAAEPKVPLITGGKSVVGKLNGGGTEISMSTMKGDVIFRKLEAGK